MSENGSPDLLFPFVNVTSVGGVFDDSAFTAGWEMGMLHAELRALAPGLIVALRRMIRTANVRQADLVAMFYGFALKELEVSECGEWTVIGLTK